MLVETIKEYTQKYFDSITMVTIIFESHGTTFDNENHVASGHFDAELSPLGENQAKELGTRYKNKNFDVIFCSDLQRSYKTGELAFKNRCFPLIKDKRIRECNYGNFTQYPSSEVEKEKAKRITIPFPDGESYQQTAKRMKDFLRDLLKNYDGKKVMIIGHRATWYGLEHLVNRVSLEKLIGSTWKWQPGWKYHLKDIL